MAFLTSFLRTLTLAFAALHFLTRRRWPGPARAARRRPAVRHAGPRSAARAALWHRAKVNFFRSGRIFLDRLIVQIDQRFECSYQAPDFMSDVRCFWRGPPLVPTAAEKRVIRDARRKLREAHPDFTLTRETRDELIRERRDEATWLRRARAAQLSPDYEAATTEVWRHIRATPRGAPPRTCGPGRRNWRFGRQTSYSASRPSRRAQTRPLEDKQAIAAAELAFHPSTRPQAGDDEPHKIVRGAARPFNGDYARAAAGSPAGP